MKFYLGIDGGGTKTLFHLADEHGNILQSYRTIGISYRQYPMDTVLQRIKEGTEACLGAQGLLLKNLSGICIGYPGYGESKERDSALEKELEEMLSPACVKVVNDVVIAWAGALNGKPGIHVVCGTGSIAYGENDLGQSMRCGGWLDYFSDEGSGYWLGRKTMQLFSQQADGRVPKGRLYSILREGLQFMDDLDFIDIMASEYIPYRDKVASMQMYLLEAAREGDRSACEIYESACWELVRLVQSLQTRLRLSDGFKVTYSGSLFRAEDLMLEPFEKALASIGGRLSPPEKEPVDGAVCIAIKEDKTNV